MFLQGNAFLAVVELSKSCPKATEELVKLVTGLVYVIRCKLPTRVELIFAPHRNPSTVREFLLRIVTIVAKGAPEDSQSPYVVGEETFTRQFLVREDEDRLYCAPIQYGYSETPVDSERLVGDLQSAWRKWLKNLTEGE